MKRRTLLASQSLLLAVSLAAAGCSNAHAGNDAEATSLLHPDAAQAAVPAATKPPAAPPSPTVPFVLDGQTYLLPVQNKKFSNFNHAVLTNAGVVWSPVPKADAARPDASVFVPSKPFTFYLSPADQTTLDAARAKELYALPLEEGTGRVYVADVAGAGDYIVYLTYAMGIGMAQSGHNQAWALKLSDPSHPRALLDFHVSGGYLYSYGILEPEGIYVSVSQYPGNADGSYSYEAYAIDIATGKKDRIESFALEGNAIRFKLQGQAVSVALTQE
ncbi:hypothetical protein GZH47_03085 [Paenibacillus rhizovicinus]|uniref:Lipoprotein n=1 Tax=Paenibacillus rhizovicinus TaxID=2704463 RepID=A0A6C0NUT9_9BACL|nr:hypothetical protein [Paenibacillus rhizovicinus]QHW29918.1 hypothetical protein GZH47_03085 [Paenibacillus rhizovicinus]